MKGIRTFDEWEAGDHTPTLRGAYLAGVEAARKATLRNQNYDPCCGLARQGDRCVCRVVWVCPLHGEHHIGRHD